MSETIEQPPQSIVSDSLRFSTKSLSHPKYKFSRVFQQTGVTDAFVAGSGTEMIFQLPVKVMNLAETELRYQVVPAAPGAGNIWVANKTPLPNIRQIQLITQSGQTICDLYFVNKYLNTIFYAETKIDDFLSLPVCKTKVTVAGTTGIPTVVADQDYGIGTHRSNYIPYSVFSNNTDGSNLTMATPVNAANPQIAYVLPRNGTGRYLSQDAAGNINATEVEPSVASNQRMFFETGPVPGGQTPKLNVAFKFKYLYNTIFAMNKDIYFGEVVNVRIVFDTPDSVYFRTTPASRVNVAAGDFNYTDALTAGPPANYTAVSNNVTLNNIGLFVAVESDPTIVNEIVNKVTTEGLKFNIPYVTTNKIAFNSQTPSISLRYNTAHGRKLRKIYYAPFHQTESGQTSYMRYNDIGLVAPNASQQIIQSFYTMLNNDRLNDFDINCTVQQDYTLLQRKLTKSALQSYRDYAASWFWVEDFSGEGPLWDKESQDYTISTGIPLTSEQKFDIYLNCTNAITLNHYVFAITEKELFIKPGSIMVN